VVLQLEWVVPYFVRSRMFGVTAPMAPVPAPKAPVVASTLPILAQVVAVPTCLNLTLMNADSDIALRERETSWSDNGHADGLIGSSIVNIDVAYC
jgi:hypothetical protein